MKSTLHLQEATYPEQGAVVQEREAMSQSHADTAGIPGGLRLPRTGRAMEQEAHETDVTAPPVGERLGQSHSTTAGTRDRPMTALPPEDADRNLDFDALVVKYEKKIFNAIYRFLGDYEEATDLTQE